MSKTIVVYFSAQGHTRRIADRIAQNLGADSFEIKPKTPYSDFDLVWQSEDARATREFNNLTSRDIELTTTDVPNWDSYDTVVICYPVWWGIAAWATNSFVKAVNWEGKTVWPCAVSHSSGVGESAQLLAKDANGGDWKEGFRFYQDASSTDTEAYANRVRNNG